MKQTDALKRIEMPNPNTKNGHVCYKNKLQPEFDFESEELKAVYQQHEAELLPIMSSPNLLIFQAFPK